jgi:dTDP-4-amino-4,6-dideoxygalactose transaminase
MTIKLVDTAAQTREVRERVEREFSTIHSSGVYIGGPQVGVFEHEFGRYLGIKHTISLNSGTDALRLALLASGMGPGDEVITVPLTFIATVAAITQTGARAVFVDVDAQTNNMDPAALRNYLEARRFATSKGPKAIVPVHLYGQPAPLKPLQEIARAWDLKLIEDACQAHGARLRDGSGWRLAGTIGEAGCFSFYPGKNLGAWGDGGAVVTNDDDIAAQVLLLRDHGRLSHDCHGRLGYNARLDAMQATVLSAKLERLDGWNAKRRQLAAHYRELLSGIGGLELPSEPAGIESCYHLFVIRSPRRDNIREELLLNDIECGIHYPVPLHLQPACRFLGYEKGDFPVAERIADTVLSLPMHPHLTPAQVERTVDVIKDTIKES